MLIGMVLLVQIYHAVGNFQCSLLVPFNQVSVLFFFLLGGLGGGMEREEPEKTDLCNPLCY